jgi:predicted CoA-substrate-specific enzyme activase
MTYFAGLDIGSTAIKVVLIDAEGAVVAHSVSPTGSLVEQNTRQALEELLRRNSIERRKLAYSMATGYGRKLVRDADESVSEITANAIGAMKAGKQFGEVRTIINIGGQDSKVIRIDGDGHVSNFAMNDKCAAGTGRFLDVSARNLELSVEALGELHFQAQGAPITINSTCTVFAESEIIGLLATGTGKNEIIAGIHFSIARRVVRLAKRVGIEDVVVFDGGPALNKGMVNAMEVELMRPVVVPATPQICTAFGAALLARDAWNDGAGEQNDTYVGRT